MSYEDRVSTVSSPKTETETGGFQDRDQDSEVPRPRLRGSRPRPRLVKTGLETSRDQDSSLENSKSDSESTELIRHVMQIAHYGVATRGLLDILSQIFFAYEYYNRVYLSPYIN